MSTFNKEEIQKKLEEELGLHILEKEDREKVIDELSNTLMERVVTALLAQMPEEEYATLESMIDSGEYENLLKRIEHYAPNMDKIALDIIEEGVKEFKQIFEEETKDLQ